MPPRQRILAVLALVTVAAALAGCGSSDVPKTLSSDQASELNGQLDAVQAAVAQGDCTTAQAHAEDFQNAVNQLPATVGTAVKTPLQDAGKNLKALATDPSQCQSSGATGPSGQQPPSSSSTTAPPPVTSTTAETTTTTTTSSTKAPPSPPPPENGGGNEGGGPGAGGQGGGAGGGSTGGVGGGTGGTGGTQGFGR
ncbi:MAG TPA: hypothetical protein VKG89_06615 [Solirubrobacterales bacterium]|nr:hypothetical protein [Solirubrobacterales bacterium]